MKELCSSCSKPVPTIRAGSITSYFFQYNYCQCEKKQSNSSSGPRRPLETEADSQTCLNCGKSRPKGQKAGSFTGYLFKELRCQCLTPKLSPQVSEKKRFGNTSTADRLVERRLSKNTVVPRANSQTNAFAPGTVIGGTFKIESTIGTGGMGTVYLAEHLSLKRKFAVKIMAPGLSEQYWHRFQSEAKLLGALKHPNLVNVYDLGIADQSVFYYSMDYLSGNNLEEILAEEGPQTLSRAIEIFQNVLAGLIYAHRNGIVHRDLKPANIFICTPSTADGEIVKILDFGISKLVSADRQRQNLTAAGEIFGSPYYMSPEQCAGAEVDVRSDIYSVGCSIFETLTGFVPFEGKSAVEIGMKHEDELPPTLSSVSDIDFPQSIELVIAKCLAKLPRERYQTAKELALDLDRIKSGKSISVAAAERSEDSHSKVEQSKIRQPGTAIAILAVIAVVGASVIFYQKSSNVNSAPESAKNSNIQDYSKTIKEDFTNLQAIDTLSLTRDGQVYDPADSKHVSDFLNSSPQNYAKKVSINGKETRVFYFPEQFSLGVIKYEGLPVKSSVNATGRVIVPAGALINLTAGNTILQNPELLKYFKADDLMALNLQGDGSPMGNIMPAVAKLTGLNYLRLAELKLTAKETPYLDSLKNLRSFSLNLSEVDSYALSQCKVLRNLMWFEFNGSENVSPVLKTLSGSIIEELVLQSSKLKDEDYTAITKLDKLRSLIINKAAIDERQSVLPVKDK